MSVYRRRTAGPFRLAAGLFLVLAAANPSRAAEPMPARLAALKSALDRNLAVGRWLEDKEPAPEDVVAATRLLQEGLPLARKYAADNPQSADAHRLLALLLCVAYRPVTITQGEPDNQKTTVVLRQGGDGCEEGLAEFAAALALSPDDPILSLHHAEARLVCGDGDSANHQLLALWDKRSSLTDPLRGRCASLLARSARARGASDAEETQWLLEAVKYSPQDIASWNRLDTLAPVPPQATWLSYEEGKALAQQEGKLLLIDFFLESCGWCRKLDREVFTDPLVASICRQFACVRVDAEQRSDLSGWLRIRSFPTVVILDPSGREVHRIVGYKPAAEYAAALQKALPPGSSVSSKEAEP